MKDNQKKPLIKGAIGLDLGSSRTVVAVAQKKGVDVLVNEASNRSTGNVVGFGQKMRYLGEQGVSQQKSNFRNTCSGFNRIMGHKGQVGVDQNEQLEKDLKWMTTKMQTEGLLGYQVEYKGEECTFSSIQVMASMLNKLRSMINDQKIDNQEMVVTVPGYFTQQERVALLDGCKVAEVKVQRVMTEMSAICLMYGLPRREEAKGQHVVFVDIGHSKLSAACVAFKADKCTIVAEQHARHLGARDMDWLALQFYDTVFQKKHGLSYISNAKCRLRMLDFIEKQRKILSGNTEAAINVESLMEDEDLNYVINREDYAIMVAGVLAEMKEQLIILKTEMDRQLIKCETVEITGGCTRMPIVQQLVQEVFGVSQVNRTLDASECIARGASLQAAIISPFFNVPAYQVEEFNYYPIDCQWRFTDKTKLEDIGQDEQGQVEKATLFKKGSVCPMTKSLNNLNTTQNIEVVLYNNPPVPGFDPLLARYLVKMQAPKEKQFNIKVKIKLNSNGLLEVEGQLNEDYTEEKKVIVKEEKEKKKEEKKEEKKMEVEGEEKKEEEKKMEEEVEQKEEIQIVKKTRMTNLKVAGGVANEQPEQVMKQWFTQESQMNNHDIHIQSILHKKNELESLVYESRQNVVGVYSEYCDEKQKSVIQVLSEQFEDWLYSEGEDATKSAYQEKLDTLLSHTRPIQNRYSEYMQLPDYFQAFQNAINEATNILNSQDEKNKHITPEDRQPGMTKLEESKNLLTEYRQKVQTCSKLLESPVLCRDVNDKINCLVNEVKSVMSKPVPVVKKEEKKEEEKKEGEKKEEEKKEEEKDNKTNVDPDIKMDVE